MFASPWIRKPDFPANGQFDYDAYWDKRGWSVAETLKPREKIICDRIPAGAKVIDIGCGNARLPVALKEKGVDITVADVSAGVLAGYKSHGIAGKVIDLEKVQEHGLTETYDYIIMSEVLEHTSNPEEIILTLTPHTKHFMLTVPNSAAYMFRYGLFVRGRFFTQWVLHPSEHLRYWSHLDFLDWLTALRLQIVHCEVTDGFSFRGRLPWLPNLWKNLLGFRMVYECETTGDTNN